MSRGYRVARLIGGVGFVIAAAGLVALLDWDEDNRPDPALDTVQIEACIRNPDAACVADLAEAAIPAGASVPWKYFGQDFAMVGREEFALSRIPVSMTTKERGGMRRWLDWHKLALMVERDDPAIAAVGAGLDATAHKVAFDWTFYDGRRGWGVRPWVIDAERAAFRRRPPRSLSAGHRLLFESWREALDRERPNERHWRWIDFGAALAEAGLDAEARSAALTAASDPHVRASLQLIRLLVRFEEWKRLQRLLESDGEPKERLKAYERFGAALAEMPEHVPPQWLVARVVHLAHGTVWHGAQIGPLAALVTAFHSAGLREAAAELAEILYRASGQPGVLPPFRLLDAAWALRDVDPERADELIARVAANIPSGDELVGLTIHLGSATYGRSGLRDTLLVRLSVELCRAGDLGAAIGIARQANLLHRKKAGVGLHACVLSLRPGEADAAGLAASLELPYATELLLREAAHHIVSGDGAAARVTLERTLFDAPDTPAYLGRAFVSLAFAAGDEGLVTTAATRAVRHALGFPEPMERAKQLIRIAALLRRP